MNGNGRSALARWRDATLFITGLGLIIHEAVIYTGPERWGLIMLFGGMVGLPVFLRQDDRRANGRATTESTPTQETQSP